jgi:NADH-quinone oxidoreductase subunit E
MRESNGVRTRDEADFERFLANLPRLRTQLLPALLLAQATLGYVPDWAVERIAVQLRLTPNEVEGVATGYPDLRRRPVGRHVVRVCTGTSCWLAGGDRLLAALEAQLGIRAGATTRDGEVTLEEVACCFVCAMAPVVEVDGVCRGRIGAEAAAALATFPPIPHDGGRPPSCDER